VGKWLRQLSGFGVLYREKEVVDDGKHKVFDAFGLLLWHFGGVVGVGSD
jgi:hypothetical protein